MSQIIPNKQLGQHWLNDEKSLNSVVKAANINSKDVILEIGPGTGLLTRKLTPMAKKVIAIEQDSSLINSLKDRVNSTNLEIINDDILKFNLLNLPKDYKIVANIPYYLTSHLIRIISESKNPPIKAVLLIQKEVAERVCAKPGQMSFLSVMAQYYWEVDLGRVITANKFTPPPKIDSQVLILTRRIKPLFKVDDEDFLRTVKAGFAKKRKTLLNSLSTTLPIEKAKLLDVCQLTGIDLSRRAQTLNLEEWYRLHCALT